MTTDVVRPLEVLRHAVTNLREGNLEHRIDVLPDATVEVRASMQRRTGPTPWYKRWYVWAAVGGAVAITGASLAIYYGTRQDEAPLGYILSRPPSGP